MSFPARLKALRMRAPSLSQRELARLAGLHEKHVRLLEREDHDHSKVAGQTLHKLCVVLGCTQDYLWAGTEPGPTDGEIAESVAAARVQTAPGKGDDAA